MMKTLLVFLFAGGILLAGSMSVGTIEEPLYPGWKGTISEEKGVPLIRNPREPLFGEITLELEEELRIGDEQDENTAFWKGVWIAVDDRGDIFILDRGNHRIQVFDAEGRYLRSIGRKGQGPGEMETPQTICLDPEGRLWLNDHFRISLFDPGGDFIRSQAMPDPVFFWAVMSGGAFLGVNYTLNQETLTRTQHIMRFTPPDYKGESVVSHPLPFGGWVGRTPVGETIIHRISMHRAGRDRVVFGHTSAYRLHLIDAAGETLRIIEKTADPIPYRKADRKKAVETEAAFLNQRRDTKISVAAVKKALSFPDHKPYFLKLEADDLGNLIVLPYPEKKSSRKPTFIMYDFFDSAGYYLYKAKMPPINFQLIRDGRIYTPMRNPDTGFYQVKRFRIVNWDSIRTRIRSSASENAIEQGEAASRHRSQGDIHHIAKCPKTGLKTAF